MQIGRIEIEVSAGELLDKISILEIKRERIQDEEKVRNVERELSALLAVRERVLPETSEIEELYFRLKRTNEALWEIEDHIRECERAQDFGGQFIELARSVYRENDGRAWIKRMLNEKLGSAIIEEKSYSQYATTH